MRTGWCHPDRLDAGEVRILRAPGGRSWMETAYAGIGLVMSALGFSLMGKR
jgi:hypothetical protein